MREEEDKETKDADENIEKEGLGILAGEGKEEEAGEEEEEEEEEEESAIPIDRGWAWMVVVGCFGMHVLVVGGVKSFGVLFVELQQLFNVSAKQLGIVHGLASVLMMGLGPVSNALSVRYSCRAVVFAGGLLIGCGFVASAWVPSFHWLYFTYSILTGLGSALAYAPSVVMVGHHFHKRRALANGISVSGSAVGSFLLPNLMQHLLNQYGLRGALLVIGGIMLHVCLAAVLFRPFSSYKSRGVSAKRKKASSESAGSSGVVSNVNDFSSAFVKDEGFGTSVKNKDDIHDDRNSNASACNHEDDAYVNDKTGDCSRKESTSALTKEQEDDCVADDDDGDKNNHALASSKTCEDDVYVKDQTGDSLGRESTSKRSLRRTQFGQSLSQGEVLHSSSKKPESSSRRFATEKDLRGSFVNQNEDEHIEADLTVTPNDTSSLIPKSKGSQDFESGVEDGYSNYTTRGKHLREVRNQKDVFSRPSSDEGTADPANSNGLSGRNRLSTESNASEDNTFQQGDYLRSEVSSKIGNDSGFGNVKSKSHDEGVASCDANQSAGMHEDNNRHAFEGVDKANTYPDLDRSDNNSTDSPRQGQADDIPKSPRLERNNMPSSPNRGRVENIPKSPHLERVMREDARSPKLSRADDTSKSPVLNNRQLCRNFPLASTTSSSTDTDPSGEVTTQGIRTSFEKKLLRNASASSMTTHFGSFKRKPGDPERNGSFKLNFRTDSIKSSGSTKRKAFRKGRPILERHPSALWDARIPESLKQAIEEEKRRTQSKESIEMGLIDKHAKQEPGPPAPFQRADSAKESTTKTPGNKRFGSFKAIDAAKPIKFLNERKKLLLANNLRYMSETRDVGAATRSLVANEKAPLKRFYSVEAGNQPSSVLHETFLHRRIRQISEADSWGSESSVFASAGDLALASLQNISESVKEEEEDAHSLTSRGSGLKGILRLSAQTVPGAEKKKRSVPLFDFSLMVNPVFLVFFLSLVCMNFGYPNVFVMLPSFCQEVGLDKTTAAFMVSIIGLTDLVGRIFIGWFSDLRLFPRKYGFMISLAAAGLLCTMLPQMKTYNGLVAFCCGFGFFGGCFIALIAVILVDFLGKERLASSFGLASVAMAVGIMAGPAIYGDIRDTAESWDVAFVVAGLMSLAASSCIFMEPLAQHFLNRQMKLTQHQIRDEML
ncbi:uncharacterized protein [Littorina saxatilis]|uniref:Major facilitator superfamily (MFS) profile domain-containing protein n=1 Tax=Littorina saxatilis TaxID=31220 RepID=A0AAN9G0F0_9CAEN